MECRLKPCLYVYENVHHEPLHTAHALQRLFSERSHNAWGGGGTHALYCIFNAEYLTGI